MTDWLDIAKEFGWTYHDDGEPTEGLWGDGPQRMAEEIARLRSTLEQISRTQYINDFDGKGNFIGTRYPQDLAADALKYHPSDEGEE